jgi:hypothetical protein
MCKISRKSEFQIKGQAAAKLSRGGTMGLRRRKLGKLPNHPECISNDAFG